MTNISGPNIELRLAFVTTNTILGLKSGVPTTDEVGGFSGGYIFHGNANKVFKDFFGGDNPFSEFFEPPRDPDMGIGKFLFC